MNENFSHPELRDGEKLLTNATYEESLEIPFKSKRLGTHAYDESGERIGSPQIRPVFVQKEELEAGTQ